MTCCCNENLNLKFKRFNKSRKSTKSDNNIKMKMNKKEIIQCAFKQ